MFRRRDEAPTATLESPNSSSRSHEPCGVSVDIMGEVATSALRRTVLRAGATVGVPAKATTKGQWGRFGVFPRMGDGAHCSE